MRCDLRSTSRIRTMHACMHQAIRVTHARRCIMLLSSVRMLRARHEQEKCNEPPVTAYRTLPHLHHWAAGKSGTCLGHS